MPVHLELFQKLWNRGIDIATGVITSVIASAAIAIIGLAFWKLKLRMDLHTEARKQRQQYQIAQELERQAHRREAHERWERLRRERDNLAGAVAVQGRNGLAELWESYLAWLRKNGLHYLPGNSHAYEMTGWSSSLRQASDVNVATSARNMEDRIRRTELPNPENSEASIEAPDHTPPGN